MVSTRTMSNVSEGGDASTSSGSGLPVKSNASKPARASSDKSPVDLALDPHADKVEPNLQYLPVEIFEKIVSNLTHRNIGYLRLVSRRMDVICGGVLNFKFQRLQTLMLTRFQTIKSKMPRRESARRTHPLACEADIVETLHMRLTLLQMTFGKHIERKHCCFFAGEILDECYRIINYINVTQKLSRPYKVTDELFDLSTMAMEYFKEHIEPSLPEIAYFNSSDFLEFTGSTYGGTSSNFLSPIEDTPTPSQSPNRAVKALVAPQGASSNTMLKNSFRRLKQEVKRNHNHLTILRRDLRTCKSKNAEQQKQLLDYSKRLDDNEKKNEETSRKFSTFLQELNKCKTELQYWRSKSPAIPPNCHGCGRAIYQAGNEDLAILNNEGILPEGWPDVNVALPEVAPAVIVEDVSDGDSMPPPKKPDETKESKAVLAGLKTVSSKRKFEDISVGSQEAGKSDELKAGGSKAKEPKTGNAKKAKMTGVPKAIDNIPSTSNGNEEGVTLRRILKPRGKPLKY